MEKTQYTDLKIVLEGDMLAKVDRMGMMNSLETRTPLLSKAVVELAAGLPMEYKLRGKTLKRIFKDTFCELLPPDYEKLPKAGFDTPVDEWFRNEMREELTELFDRDRIESQGIFDCDFVRQILEEHFNRKKNRKNEIWALYLFEKWYERNFAAPEASLT